MEKTFEGFFFSVTRTLLPGFIGACCKSLLLVPCPYLLKLIVDVHVPHRDVRGIFISVGLCIFLALAYVVVALYSNRLIARKVSVVGTQLRRTITEKLGSVQAGELENRFSSDVQNLFFVDLQKVETCLVFLTNNFIPSLLYSTVMGCCLFFLDWRIGLLVAVLIALSLIARISLNRALQVEQRRESETQKALARSFSELIHGQRFLRLIGNYSEFATETNLLSEKYGECRRTLSFVVQKLLSVLVMGQHLINVTVITCGALATIFWGGSIGVLIASILMLPIILGPLQQLPDAAEKYFSAKQAHERIRQYLTLPDEPVSGEVFHHRGAVEITLKNVFFRHKKSSLETISDFSHVIDRGEVVAIVGESGGGKTTLAHLVLGLYFPDKGSIRIDGTDTRELDLIAFRKRVGFVPQDPIVFNGTIHDNIRLGCGSVEMEDVRRAATMANAHGFITEFPEGYDYVVGEKGGRLSGGQRQRIALARALLRNPSLLVLDEATSALDEENEAAIQCALSNIRGRQTALVIAHRLSTISIADRVLQISGGKLCDVISPEAWIKKSFRRQMQLTG